MSAKEKKEKPLPEFHLKQTLDHLGGPTPAQITSKNQWAAAALDQFHANSQAQYEFRLNNKTIKGVLKWDSDFSKAAMREKTKMAEEGGEALAYFAMSVLLKYSYAIQSEIGTGFDYVFHKKKPASQNFMKGGHYVEVSALNEESSSNTLTQRLREKQSQIKKGKEKVQWEGDASAVVTLFSQPVTVKEPHE